MNTNNKKKVLLEAAERVVLLDTYSCAAIQNALIVGASDYKERMELRREYAEFYGFDGGATNVFIDVKDMTLARSLALLLYRETL